MLKLVVVDMEEKFKKYWTTIPYLYSFGFMLDLRMRLTKFYDILRLIEDNIDIPYTNTVYKDTEARFYGFFFFSSYEEGFCNEDTRPPEVEVGHYDSPVKRTYSMLVAAGTSQSSTSSHSWSSPRSQY